MNRRQFIKRGALFVPSIFIPRILRANSIPTFKQARFFNPPAPVSGGGGSGWTLIGEVEQAGTTGSTVSPTLDTTGATLLIAVADGFSGSTDTITDSKSNSGWVDAVSYFNNHLSIWYNLNPSSVGAGHTVTIANPNGGFNVKFYAYKKTGGGAVAFDGISTGNTTGFFNSTLASGSLTPSASGDLMISALFYDAGSGAPTVGSGFTAGTLLVNGGNVFLNAATKVKTDALAENPTWAATVSGNADAAAIQAAFK